MAVETATPWQNRIVDSGWEDPEQLLANPENWRTHPAYQQDALEAVLDEVGWVTRVIVNRRTGNLVDGHLRVALALRRGEPQVPTDYIDVTPDEERLILATLDPISALATTDRDKLRTLLSDIETENAGVSDLLDRIARQERLPLGDSVQEREARVDEADELKEKWGTEPGQLWVVPAKAGGEHRILCGDATNEYDVMRLRSGAPSHLMVTDPPYGVNYDPAFRQDIDGTNRHAVGQVTNDDRVDWSEVWEFFDSDVIYLWHAGVHAAETARGLERVGYEIRSQIVWMKGQFVVGRGHYHWQHEPCWYAVRKGRTAHWQGDRKQSTIWQIDTVHATQGGEERSRTVHGTQKPLESYRRPIRNHTRRGDVVVDPFLGSGTLIAACEELERVGFGMELDPRYVAVTLERLSEMGLAPELHE